MHEPFLEKEEEREITVKEWVYTIWFMWWLAFVADGAALRALDVVPFSHRFGDVMIYGFVNMVFSFLCLMVMNRPVWLISFTMVLMVNSVAFVVDMSQL